MNHSRLDRILGQHRIIGKEELDRIPVIECGEPIVDLLEYVPLAVPRMSERRAAFSGGQILLARETIARMLSEVVKRLLPKYRLLVYDAYRPIEYQRRRFEQILAETRGRYPGLSEDELRALVFEVVFPPDMDSQRPPPHSTGGAVDVSLEATNDNRVDMGSTYGVYGTAQENLRHHTNTALVTASQRQNRFILVQAMVESGFCNYPGEWWHFMYGDREFAAYEGLSSAMYGRCDLLEDPRRN